MSDFNSFGLSPALLKGIDELGFVTPTPVQESVIPVILQTSHDIIGLAQTGTGKTAAFGLPILQQIDINNRNVQAVILSPTRELCIQIAGDMEKYSKFQDGVKITAVYGGAKIDSQIKALKGGVHVIVATPGRMLDLIKRKSANIKNVNTVVLDEADEMLNMGFRDELDGILETTPAEKRTLLFSATMPAEVARIASNYMNKPQQIVVGKQNSGAKNVRHIYYQVHAKDRYLALKRVVDVNPDIYGIVFCRTRQETKEAAEKLIRDGYNADALHGDLSQVQRDQVMNRFRNRSLQILVATDVAARGLDVHDITHVINYNLPEDTDVYTHRSGRTGRADKSGVSIAIVNYREKSKIPQIERMLGKKFEKLPIPSGREICEKQLFNLIDRMENVKVDEEQIQPFLERVNKKLAWLEKDDIVKRFIALEFNRFLDYYKNAPELNSGEKDDEGRGGRKGRNKGRERNNDRQERGNRSRGGSRNSAYTKIFINLGKKDRLEPKNIIGMVNDKTGDRDINFGEIDIRDSFSFFEVSEQHAHKVVESLENGNYKGRDMRVEFSGKVPGSKKSTGAKKPKGRPKKRK